MILESLGHNPFAVRGELLVSRLPVRAPGQWVRRPCGMTGLLVCRSGVQALGGGSRGTHSAQL